MQHWFTYPHIDPVAFRLGPLAVHWYGISYLVGFLAVGRRLSRRSGLRRLGLTAEAVQDFLVYAVVGVLIGGRLFFVLADIVTKHQEALYFGAMPGSLYNVIAVWNGGMGFFGGMLGVLAAIALFVRKHPGLRFNVLADEVAVMLPVGIALTRVVNFINDELVGDVCVPDRPWCMVFPGYAQARYPSQIVEGVLDLLVLPILLLLSRPRPPDGVVAWTWFALYGLTRSVAELWRQTDLSVGPLTGGQLLALPMMLIGIVLAVRAARADVRTDLRPLS